MRARVAGPEWIEAMQRGQWQQPGGYREHIEDVILDLEDGFERPAE